MKRIYAQKGVPKSSYRPIVQIVSRPLIIVLYYTGKYRSTFRGITVYTPVLPNQVVYVILPFLYLKMWSQTLLVLEVETEVLNCRYSRRCLMNRSIRKQKNKFFFFCDFMRYPNKTLHLLYYTKSHLFTLITNLMDISLL